MLGKNTNLNSFQTGKQIQKNIVTFLTDDITKITNGWQSVLMKKQKLEFYLLN